MALGIGGIAGVSVAAFEKEDADCLLFFCMKGEKAVPIQDRITFRLPAWHAVPTRTRSMRNVGRNMAALRPIPHRRQPPDLAVKAVTDIIPSAGANVPSGSKYNDAGESNMKMSTGSSLEDSPVLLHYSMQRTPMFLGAQGASFSPLSVDKHNCNRSPIRVCSEVTSHTSNLSKDASSICNTYT